ncbi:hypothetical protein L1F30_11840 [Simiduia sp. 21SJ11W-1]|uniref:hypothetical protein n=1 Tax=Simiduia sp. 21SJ11W-1 TaxID=2909669 RepID=UPI00209DBE8A|nr:hypothetical protein [Simiduia sp. 21SJ11W-1]UTA46852.1 hypothetical protein L1F30_11840 [Simiduia sp. 21SJ11W-1]
MSVSLTDPMGRRFRILHGWGSGPCNTHNICRGHAEASSFVERLSNEQLSEVLRCFFGGTDHRPRHLRETPVNRSSLHRHAIPTVTRTPAQRVAEAICNSHLVVQADTSLTPIEDPRSVLRMKIRQALGAILLSERQEAARHEALLSKESSLNKGLINTGAAMTGLGKAAWGLLCWVKEVSDLVNPVVRLHNQYTSAKNAWGEDNFLEVYAKNHMAAEWREVVEVMGFDPSQISKQQMAEAMEAADLVWSDTTLRQDLKNFAWDYAKAQHAIELTEMGGGAAFEIILTAILAAVTGGVGAVASMASKARHMTKFKKLGELLVDFAKASKQLAAHTKARAKQAAKAAKKSFDDLKTDMDAPVQKGERPRARKNSNRVTATSEEIRIRQARKRQHQMLEDNVGYNISPTSWDSYPTIGRNGTFVSDSQGISDVLGDFQNMTSINAADVAKLEKDFGLEPGTLNGGFKIRKVENINDKLTRSPLEGNKYFLGPGKHLPGGAPELVIESIPTVDSNDVKTIAEIIVK